jgi:hypothetical protein
MDVTDLFTVEDQSDIRSHEQLSLADNNDFISDSDLIPAEEIADAGSDINERNSNISDGGSDINERNPNPDHNFNYIKYQEIEDMALKSTKHSESPTVLTENLEHIHSLFSLNPIDITIAYEDMDQDARHTFNDDVENLIFEGGIKGNDVLFRPIATIDKNGRVEHDLGCQCADDTLGVQVPCICKSEDERGYKNEFDVLHQV